MNEIAQVASILAADPGMDSIVRILEGLRNALMAVLITLSIVALTYAGVRYVMSVAIPPAWSRESFSISAPESHPQVARYSAWPIGREPASLRHGLAQRPF